MKMFIPNEALLVGSGGESTETLCENLRIAKVLEAFYPHRSVIPDRPSVSSAVEDESFDDGITPNIRLTPIEDEHAAVAAESCHSPKSPSAVFGLGPDLNLAALSALMNTKEQGSLIDADLLVKFLTDPEIIKSLMNDIAGKPLETGKPGLVLRPGNGVTNIVPVSVQSSVCVATQPVSSALSMNQKPPLDSHTYPSSPGLKPLPRLVDSLKPIPVDDDVVVSVPKPQSQSLNNSTSSTWNTMMNSAPDALSSNGAYPMKINREDPASAKQPVKNLDYFKNLIREHGGVTPATNETNSYKGRVENSMRLVNAKAQKPCIFFGKARGCKLGESCLYLHDHSKRFSAAPEFPRAKRTKFGT
ncbi:unnamed protein product [Thlaspi arvense]|uniref:C3H1-type domain-containing protein n=1 Tax=Thlaspi arvense TaxID=13288 RepID=A0AAU9RMH1_THLAR|nr:unnamed protein product [Thlaspi arvense]